MKDFKIGFSRVCITPMRGISVTGYYSKRYAEKTLDDLEINAMALSLDGETAIMLTVDNLHVGTDTCDAFREYISNETKVPRKAIYIHSTHTHTGPELNKNAEGELEREYYQFVYRKISDVSKAAIEDLKTASTGYGTGRASGLSFIRRYRMKDGGVRTNPGVNNPDILHPIGEVDDRVHVIRFDREDGDTVILVNFANHPDVISGSGISADWPGFVRKYTEQCFPGSKCICFNGAQGDVNHINVHPVLTVKDMMSESGRGFGYEHSKYLGRAIAGCVMQIFDKVKKIEIDKISFINRTVQIPLNKGKPEDMEEAHRLYDIYISGKGEALRKEYPGMLYETRMAEVCRMVRLENGPDNTELELSGLSFGKIAFIGIPGEPFTEIGRALKDTEGWDLIIPTCTTNGSSGYFPMQDSYLEGGYEAKSSSFKVGTAELLIEEGKKLLCDLALG